MFRIGEFSKLTRVSARMLRHYDKCGLLRPAEIDRFTGYRLYSASQIPLLNRIVALRDMGFGVEEIERALPYYDDAVRMRNLLAKKRRQIERTIAAEQGKLERIVAMSGAMRKEFASMIYDVELKQLPQVSVLALRETIPAYDAEYTLWEKMGAFIQQNGIVCGAGGYSIYHDDEHKESDVDVEIAVPVDMAGESRDGFVYKRLESIPLAATIRFSGPYENYTPAIEKLASWLEQNGYQMTGLIRGLCVAGPQDKDNPDPSDFLTELQVPVQKA